MKVHWSKNVLLPCIVSHMKSVFSKTFSISKTTDEAKWLICNYAGPGRNGEGAPAGKHVAPCIVPDVQLLFSRTPSISRTTDRAKWLQLCRSRRR